MLEALRILCCSLIFETALSSLVLPSAPLFFFGFDLDVSRFGFCTNRRTPCLQSLRGSTAPPTKVAAALQRIDSLKSQLRVCSLSSLVRVHLSNRYSSRRNALSVSPRAVLGSSRRLQSEPVDPAAWRSAAFSSRPMQVVNPADLNVGVGDDEDDVDNINVSTLSLYRAAHFPCSALIVLSSNSRFLMSPANEGRLMSPFASSSSLP